MGTLLQTIKQEVKNWWLLVLTGILFILTGIFTFAYPVSSYLALAIFFGIAILFGGLFKIFFAISNSNEMTGWGWTLASGIIDTIIGGVLTWNPAVSAVVLPFVIGFYMVFAGGSLISLGTDAKAIKLTGAGWTITGGVLTLLLGIIILFYPAAGAATAIMITGVAFLLTGITYCLIGFRLKEVKKLLKNLTHPHPPNHSSS